MISTIIDEINNTFKAYLTEIPVQIHGIAEPFIRRDMDEEKEVETMMPAIEVNGEMRYPFIDDDYKFGFYHKINSKKYDVSQKEGTGDNPKTTITASMSLVCWGFGLKSEILEEFFAYKKPNIMVFTDTIFDRNTVFAGEFKGVTFFLPPEVSLFKINYTVKYIQKAECIEINEIFTN